MTAQVLELRPRRRPAAPPPKPTVRSRELFQDETGISPEDYLRRCAVGRIPLFGQFISLRFEAELLAPEYADMMRNVQPIVPRRS